MNLEAPAAEPYESGEAELDDYLHLLMLYVKRYVARFGYRMMDTSGKLNDLHVSIEEATTLFSRDRFAPREDILIQPLKWPGEETLAATIEGHLHHMQRRLEATPDEARRHLPVESLRRRASLSALQIRLLLAAAGPALSIDLARLYAFAWADFAIKQPSVGFLAELCADTPPNIRANHHELRGGSPLIRNRMMVLRNVDRWGVPTPSLHCAVQVPERVVSYLLGQEHAMSGRIFDVCQVYEPHAAPDPASLVLREATRTGVHVALERAQGHPLHRPRLLLYGPSSSGRRSTLYAYLAQSGKSLLVADLDRLAQTPETFEDALAEVLREALLQESMVLLRGEDFFSSRETLSQFNRPLHRLLAPYEGLLALSTKQPTSQLNHLVQDLYEVEFFVPTPPEQRELWRRATDALECEIEEDVPRILTQRMSVTAGQIFQAVGEARSRALVRSGGQETGLRADDLTRAIRRRADHLLGSIAEPFSTTLTWDDAVLPEKLERRLREILAQARYREMVYDEWGFRRKVSYGHGLSCLFSGAPGTGKTMMAGILAKELGREVYRVDLSRVVSKWVGETEKNLGKAFEEAEKGQVILLFDEADALFSKRSSGESAQDRFANMEVNYLLQRMENYDGMTVLTTNNEQQIDEAFKRRLKFRISFPTPDAEHRALLWKAMLPDEAKVEKNIEFDYLGVAFEMCGGNIRNAVLRAAFYAADEGTSITFEHLYRAALSEAAEMGMVVRDEEGVGY